MEPDTESEGQETTRGNIVSKKPRMSSSITPQYDGESNMKSSVTENAVQETLNSVKNESRIGTSNKIFNESETDSSNTKNSRQETWRNSDKKKEVRGLSKRYRNWMKVKPTVPIQRIHDRKQGETQLKRSK